MALKSKKKERNIRNIRHIEDRQPTKPNNVSACFSILKVDLLPSDRSTPWRNKQTGEALLPNGCSQGGRLQRLEIRPEHIALL